jgi:hypothetical protein
MQISRIDERLAEMVAEIDSVESRMQTLRSLDAKVYGPLEAKRLRDKAMRRPDTPPVKAGNITMRQHLLRLSDRWEKEPQKIIEERVTSYETARVKLTQDLAAARDEKESMIDGR